MKSRAIAERLKIAVLVLVAPVLLSWGTFGHMHINHAAVLALPSPLGAFFYNHIDYLTQESPGPDIRRSVFNDKSEGPRHFIDLENFGDSAGLPTTLDEATRKYDEKFLLQNGILPWEIEDLTDKLTKAFRQKRKAEILFLAADLGHYIGDANTPLHTTVNYDGQLSGQKGIHSFWESKVAEMFGDTYKYRAGEVKYITDIPNEVWNMINVSHALADTLLLVDKQLKQKLPEDVIYVSDSLKNMTRNKFAPRAYTDEYTRQYHLKLNGMVEKQLLTAIRETASFWFTAWVNAGKPDLSTLDSPDQTKRNKSTLRKELKLLNKGRLMDVKTGSD